MRLFLASAGVMLAFAVATPAAAAPSDDARAAVCAGFGLERTHIAIEAARAAQAGLGAHSVGSRLDAHKIDAYRTFQPASARLGRDRAARRARLAALEAEATAAGCTQS